MSKRVAYRKKMVSKNQDGRYSHCLVQDMEYDDEELEFFRAVDRFKSQTHDPFPTLRDLLRLLKGLGYSRGIKP
jgi:hypothetical protein